MEILTLSPSLTQEIQAEARAARKSVEELLTEARNNIALKHNDKKSARRQNGGIMSLLKPAKSMPENTSPFTNKKWLTMMPTEPHCMIAFG